MRRLLPLLAVGAAAVFLLTRDEHVVALGAPGFAARGPLLRDRDLLVRAARLSGFHDVLWAGERNGARVVVMRKGDSVVSVRVPGGAGDASRFRSSDLFVPIAGDGLLLGDRAPDAYDLVGAAGHASVVAPDGVVDTPGGAGALLARSSGSVSLIMLPERRQLVVPRGEAGAMRAALLDDDDGPLVLAALRAAAGLARGRLAAMVGRTDVVRAPLGQALGARAAAVLVADRFGAPPVFAVGYREREGARVHAEVIATDTDFSFVPRGAVGVRFLKPGWLAIAGDPRIARLEIDTDSAELAGDGRFVILDSAFAGTNPQVRGYTADGKRVDAVVGR